MLKENLRQTNYVQSDKEIKMKVFHIAAAIIIIGGITLTFFLLMNIRGVIIMRGGKLNFNGFYSAIEDTIKIIGLSVFIFFMIIEIFLYYFFVKLFSSLFCEKKFKNTRLTILKYTQMPVCICKEALRPYQFVLSYIIPMIFVYIQMFFVCIYATNFGFMLSLIIFIILTAPDLVLTGYIIHLARTEKPDYISIENHLYGMTLFKRYSYSLKRNKSKNKGKISKVSNSIEKRHDI